MTKRTIVCIFDTAVEAYGQPIFCQSIGAGLRSFADECNRAADDNTLYKHPEDYALWYLGQFDDESGLFVDHENVRVIGRAMDHKK